MDARVDRDTKVKLIRHQQSCWLDMSSELPPCRIKKHEEKTTAISIEPEAEDLRAGLGAGMFQSRETHGSLTKRI